VKPDFGGKRVLTLESRRASEIAVLIANNGGEPMVAPALREAPLESNTVALTFADALMRRQVDIVVLLTGVGTRALVSLAEPVHGRGPFIDALARTTIVARGPKAVAALRELGLSASITAPPPQTWRDVLIALDARTDELPLKGARVAVQEYGLPNVDLARELEARGAVVTTVPIYRWLLPENVEPLREAAGAIVRGDLEVILLTSGIQLVHLLDVAAQMGCKDDVRAGLVRMVIASIGPMTSEELRRHDLKADFEPTIGKLGVLVRETAQRCNELLRAKQRVRVRAGTA
jgi:uroporphyrinogen-III synthase